MKRLYLFLFAFFLFPIETTFADFDSDIDTLKKKLSIAKSAFVELDKSFKELERAFANLMRENVKLKGFFSLQDLLVGNIKNFLSAKEESVVLEIQGEVLIAATLIFSLNFIANNRIVKEEFSKIVNDTLLKNKCKFGLPDLNKDDKGLIFVGSRIGGSKSAESKQSSGEKNKGWWGIIGGILGKEVNRVPGEAAKDAGKKIIREGAREGAKGAARGWATGQKIGRRVGFKEGTKRAVRSSVKGILEGFKAGWRRGRFQGALRGAWNWGVKGAKRGWKAGQRIGWRVGLREGSKRAVKEGVKKFGRGALNAAKKLATKEGVKRLAKEVGKKAVKRVIIKIGSKVTARLIPGLGWTLLIVDAIRFSYCSYKKGTLSLSCLYE